jgi:hypothetical protein
MESWLPFFVIVTTLGVVLQVAVLVAMYLQFRRTAQHLSRVSLDLQSRLAPILTRLQLFLDDTQPRITTLVTDAAEIVHLARGQAQKVDRVFTEAADRLRNQLMHVDQILTGTLEAVEDTGLRIRRTISGPVMQVSALVRGIQAGLEFFRARRRTTEETIEQPDEGLFI